MEIYNLKINTIDNLYADYMVEAKTIAEANKKVKEAFYRDYPEADENIIIELVNPDSEKIREIINIIRGESNDIKKI